MKNEVYSIDSNDPTAGHMLSGSHDFSISRYEFEGAYYSNVPIDNNIKILKTIDRIISSHFSLKKILLIETTSLKEKYSQIEKISPYNGDPNELNKYIFIDSEFAGVGNNHFIISPGKEFSEKNLISSFGGKIHYKKFLDNAWVINCFKNNVICFASISYCDCGWVDLYISNENV